MAGIYIHIPYCRQACHYCNFHFSTSLKSKALFLEALKKEMEMRKDFFGKEKVKTVYFGGGTPSLLTAAEINELLNTLSLHYDLSGVSEITLESNPEDLTAGYLKELKQTPVNRLSIGVQSFNDARLKFMNRIHDSLTARYSVLNAASAGFDNLTIDLIYGIPGLNDEEWIHNIRQALELPVNHLSCYALTVEEKTALEAFIRRNKIQPVDEEQSARQFEILMDEMEKAGWIHYEISNFSKSGLTLSQHNSSYWEGLPYLGLGPSAHSFNLNVRSFNTSNNYRYISSLMNNIQPAQSENLSETDCYNEYIMTGLRTCRGVDLATIESRFGNKKLQYLISQIGQVNPNHFIMTDKKILLTKAGKLFADRIAAALFYV